jgi:polar amino acid transport system substrate-binding protein
MHAARLGAGTAAVIAVLGLSGCAFNPLSTFTTPTIDQIERETVTPTVSDDALATPGTLTVALDTSDAPQAMQGADGNLTGYAVDAARALASRMGLKVAFVDASSADSALGDKKADIFIGDINSADGDISTLGTCLYDAAAVFGKTSDGESLSVSTETLNTATLGVQTSSASQEALAKQSITANQKTFSNINECFEALESGEIDYVICDSTAGGYLARLMSQISYVGALETPSTLGVAGLAANDELCRAVSDALDGITVDGTLEAVHSVWYGTMPYDLTTKTVSGADVQSTDTGSSESSSSDSSSEGAASEDKSSSQEGTITDDDINKLNS